MPLPLFRAPADVCGCKPRGALTTRGFIGFFCGILWHFGLQILNNSLPLTAVAALLLLADEMTRNCKDWSYIEQVGFNLREEVYIASDACDEARNAYIAAARARTQKGGTR